MPIAQESSAAGSQGVDDAVRRHRESGGKVQMMPKCPIRGLADFAVWYTPGVAAVCRAIQSQPDEVFDLTNRANTVAIVSDGTRVLGLGNIGPEAGLPVMEGKAMLFKFLGGVDAIPLCVRTQSVDELCTLVQALEPSFGGINLEDISQPKCFRVLERLRTTMSIPVWHDDQQGSATAVLAGLTNALKVVGKCLAEVRIAMIGIGAAGVPTYRLLVQAGANPQRIMACDSRGILHAGRNDLRPKQEEFAEKWSVCQQSNGEQRQGGIAEALVGADVCVAFSRPGPGVIRPEWLRQMAPDAIVFACANPVPEVWPSEAREAGVRIVGTGRSDFPNQINNALVFPAIFRGALDVRARTITDGMAMAAAHELAAAAEERGVRDDRILLTMEDWQVFARVAVATAMQAQREEVARCPRSADELRQGALDLIHRARQATRMLDEAGLIGP